MENAYLVACGDGREEMETPSRETSPGTAEGSIEAVCPSHSNTASTPSWDREVVGEDQVLAPSAEPGELKDSEQG